MKKFTLCLYIATTVAWPSGVYIRDHTNSQFYNPLTQPHEQLDLGINFRSSPYGVAQKLVDEAQMCIALNKRCVLPVHVCHRSCELMDLA